MSRNNSRNNSRVSLGLSRSASPASLNSLHSSHSEIIENGYIGTPNGTPQVKTRYSTTAKSSKAKRIRFFHNGNKFFNGVMIPVTPERYRSFDSLTGELTKLLEKKNVVLPNGVRSVYTLDGKKISCVEELVDGKDYVAAGKGECFKKIDYSKLEVKVKVKSKNSLTPVPKVSPPDCVRPRIVTMIRHGIKPRKILRLLLNKRNSTSMEQVLSAFSEVALIAVRKVYTASGQLVTALPQFFEDEDVFFIYGNERQSVDDFELDFEESKIISQYRKKINGLRNGNGPKPAMPKKELNRTYSETSLLRKLSLDPNIALPGNLKGKYTVGKTIGDGNFAVVRLCKDISTGKEFALKIIDKNKSKGKEDIIENEVKILRRISHPYIMSLIEDQDSPKILYLVCEYVSGGDLFDCITKFQTFPEDQAALMIKHLASALAYLHNLNIVHRDVKPENLLVKMEGDRVKYLKLADFGLACEVTKPLYTVCGTPTYVAPEILAESGYGLKIDVWAAGVILYILLCGYAPFASHDNDQEKLFDCILAGQYDFPDEFWQFISDEAKELIQNMLQLSPEIRFSAEDVLDYPWLAQAAE